ncbi:hypothetical protein PIB30_091188, partial [Stylosanthes scabra]|nr:hypothetical protein [Stylosanthes scabra]
MNEINSNIQLMLPKEKWITVLVECDDKSFEFPIFSGTIRGTILDDKEDCKVIKIPIKIDDYQFKKVITTRFKAGKFLDKKYFILPRQIIRDDNHLYFCYESYNHNLMTLMEADKDPKLWKDVILGFIEALHYLHIKSKKNHGHITYYNLVTSNRKGYLAGGIGDTFKKISPWLNKKHD